MVSVPIGHRFPDDAPAQMRVKLAWSDAKTRQALLRRWKPVAHTPTTITDRALLEKEIGATLARGYSVSRAEFTPGVMSLAAPVFNSRGQLELILQCPGVEPDVAAREREIATVLLETTRRLTALRTHTWDSLPGGAADVHSPPRSELGTARTRKNK